MTRIKQNAAALLTRISGSKGEIMKILLWGALGLAGTPPIIAAQQSPAAQQPPAGQRPPAGQQGPSLGHAHELVINLASKSAAKLTVTSPAFKDGADIPYENTQYRGNIFPGITWSKGPGGTRSYALVVQGASLTSPGVASSIHNRNAIQQRPVRVWTPRSALPENSQARGSRRSVTAEK